MFSHLQGMSKAIPNNSTVF